MNTSGKPFLAGLILILSFQLVAAQTGSLEQHFRNPPASAKPGTIWFWMNGNVTKEGITADLEAMKQIGIQEAIIFNVSLGHPQGAAPFLGEEWLDFFHFAALEASRLGLDLGFHNGAGWSSSGHPSITPEFAMQELVYSETICPGGQMRSIQLPQPTTALSYYRDVAVLAFPKPESDVRIDHLEIKTLSHKVRNHLVPDDKLIAESALVQKEEIIDLTSLLQDDGQLDWQAPEGEWVILRIGHTPTGEMNRFPAEGGRGLECDKMSSKAVDLFFQQSIMPIISRLDTLIGSTVYRCHIDSYEVGTTNWTSGFEDLFSRLRMYDCRLYLPALAGYYVESGEETERFLWDFRRTIGDLIAENYYGRMSELSHQAGMTFSIEPYWGPFDNMQVGETADLVMSEFWSGSLAFFDSPKFVASIAKLNGSPIAEAEAFTGVGGWDQHPGSIKTIGDLAWAQGINRFVFHCYVHQPWNTGPGLTLQVFGTHFNRLNTWWEQGKPFVEYVQRSQFLLQQGSSVADVLVFTGESSPNDALLIPEIKTLGYDYDLIGGNHLQSLSVREGMISTVNGDLYRALVLPETNWMTPENLRRIKELTDSGGIVLGSRPEKSPSLHHYPICDEEVLRLADELWDSGQIEETSVIDFLKRERIPPDFSVEIGDRESIDFIHRKTENTDIYFLAGSAHEGDILTCRFRITGKRPEIWSAETGEITMACVWRENSDGTTTVSIPFGSNTGLFVLFREPTGSVPHIVEVKQELVSRPINPLPGLAVEQAEYGVFLPEGLVDVTDAVRERLDNQNLMVQATRRLCSCDPAPGYKKELRIRYRIAEDTLETNAFELEWLQVDGPGTDELEILQAVFGKFERGYAGIPPAEPVFDVTEELNRLLDSGMFEIPVSESFRKNRTSSHPFELRVRYSSNGEGKTILVKDEEVLRLSEIPLQATINSVDASVNWMTAVPGEITYRTSTGKQAIRRVDSVPPPIELAGSWDVEFSWQDQRQINASFDSLISWPEIEEADIRYFSGTARYTKEFHLSSAVTQPGYSLKLDLGNVREIAEVFINGNRVEILWKAPFILDIDEYVHPGANTLEVKITNLWPNRLIGDEQLPLDYERRGPHVKVWPDWLQSDAPRTSGRTTFAGYQHWSADDDLLPSGLLGPVRIVVFRVEELDIQ